MIGVAWLLGAGALTLRWAASPAPAASAAITASETIPAFTVLTAAQLTSASPAAERRSPDLLPSDAASASVTVSAPATAPTSAPPALDAEILKLVCRITLHRIEQGEIVTPADLGPVLPSSASYQIVALRIVAPLPVMRVGDTLDLALVPLPQTGASALPSPGGQAAATAVPHRARVLNDVILLQLGSPEADGLIAVLIAVPSDGQTADRLSEALGQTQAYPVYASAVASSGPPASSTAPDTCQR